MTDYSSVCSYLFPGLFPQLPQRLTFLSLFCLNKRNSRNFSLDSIVFTIFSSAETGRYRWFRSKESSEKRMFGLEMLAIAHKRMIIFNALEKCRNKKSTNCSLHHTTSNLFRVIRMKIFGLRSSKRLEKMRRQNKKEISMGRQLTYANMTNANMNFVKIR